MYRVNFLCASMNERVLAILLDALVTMNELYLERNPSTPRLADARIKSRQKPVQGWQDIPTLLERGAGSTEAITCWRVAELRQQGIAAAPQFVCMAGLANRTVRLCHAAVRLPDGSIEMPRAGAHEPSVHADRQVSITSGLFSRRRDHDESGRALRVLLEALCSINELYLAAHPSTPPLYATGVRYQAEPIGHENWLDIPTALQWGLLDCEDLACWRVSEWRRRGVHAAPEFSWKFLPSGVVLYHVFVKLPDGTTEDPSRALGMGSNRRNREVAPQWAFYSSP